MKAPGRPIRVLTADTQPLFRDSLERALESRPDLDLVSRGVPPAELAERIREGRPDVAVVDDALVPGGSVAALGTRVVLLTAAPGDPRTFEAIEQGAAGCVSRDHDADALHDAILRVAAGGTVLDGRAQTSIARELRLREGDGRPLLSARERRVLELIADGRSVPEIAHRLQLGCSTVKTHLAHVYDKLGVGERAAAVAEAMRHGLIE